MNGSSQHKVIDLDNVSFGWAGRQSKGGDDGFRLDISAFSLQRGEKLLLLGPSGSGKSTLLGLICGTLQAQAGSISICGTRLDQLSAGARDGFRADHLGVIFQLFNLVPYLSVLENVLLPLHFSKLRRERVGADSAARAAQASKLLAQLGLPAAILEKATVTLSVGQQQRVAAARALIGAPDLIVADEPTSSLDAALQRDFLTLLFDQIAQNDGALLMVSHDERLADQFDRVVQLEDILTLDRGVPGAEMTAAPSEKELTQ